MSKDYVSVRRVAYLAVNYNNSPYNFFHNNVSIAYVQGAEKSFFLKLSY